MTVFSDWSILVTGAASGIGAAAARTFASRGGSVIGVDIDADGLERTERSIGAGRFRPVVADLATPDGRTAAVDACDGTLDVLVNNAAVFLLAADDATDHQWQRTLDVNLLAPAKLSAALRPLLARSERPAIVNVCSISAHVAQSGRWTYNASKGGLLELTRCQALDFAPDGIRVNSVSPGWIWTEVLDEAAGGDRPTWERVWGTFSVFGRCGEPEEVARSIAFLASSDATFITGVDLPVDGGYLAMGVEAVRPLDLDKG